MKNKTDRSSKAVSIIVLVIVAVLVVLAFMYLTVNKNERQDNQGSPETIETQETNDNTSINPLNEEELYTPSPTAEPKEQEENQSSDHENGHGDTHLISPASSGVGQVTDAPAEASVDPIDEGQLE